MTAVATIARSAVPEFHYATPEQPDFMAMGLQSVIQFNGLNLNDRLRPDRYLIQKITGLGQPDIRDNRIARPSEHGEIPYDSFYGGCTMTFEGRMEANSQPEIGRLERDLRAALGPLVESPMKFNWWDIHDEFSDAMWSNAFWTPLSGALLNIPGDGTFRFTNAGIAYSNLRKYVDARVGAQVVISRPLGTASWGIAYSIADSENYIKFYVNANGSNVFTINLAYVLNGVETALANPITITTPKGGQSVWLTIQSNGDNLVGNAYMENPTANPSAVAIASMATSLSGSIANKFGYGAGGMAGVFASGNLTSWMIQDFRVDSIWPGDFYISVRPIAPLQPARAREGTTSRFMIPFQFAVRASNPRILSPVMLTNSMGPTTQPNLGRIYNRTFPQFDTVPITELGFPANPVAEQQAICTNKGTWVAQPKLKIQGGITNPVITNLTTGQKLILNCTIAENDFLIVDCAAHTITNSAGANQFGVFDPSSTWINLVPGDNQMILTGSKSIGSPLCIVMWKHTWI